MESPTSSGPRVDEFLARAVDEQLAEQRSWRDALDGFAARLERLERTVEQLQADLAGAAEAGARAAVSGEMKNVADGLRRQIDGLGRLLVNDLGRLPHLVRESVAAATVAANGPAEPVDVFRANPAPAAVVAGAIDDVLPVDEDLADEAGDRRRRGRFRRS